MHFGATTGVFLHAKKLRKNPTYTEKILWRHLRKNQLGYRFRRQHPTFIFVTDFYCHYLRLVIEIDGLIHTNEEIKLSDKEREAILIGLGLRILRFTNEEVTCNIDDVISRIYAKIEEIKNGDLRPQLYY